MSKFNQLCREFEEMQPEEYTQTVKDLSGDILAALDADEDKKGLETLRNFVLAAVAADGKLSAEEYLATVPMFSEFFGEELANYADCEDFVRNCKGERKELKNYTNMMTDLLGRKDDYLKDDIVTVCLLFCAIDGKVSAREKRWIKKLMK